MPNAECVICGGKTSKDVRWFTHYDVNEDRTGIVVSIEVSAKRRYFENGDDRIHTKAGTLCPVCLREYAEKMIEKAEEAMRRKNDNMVT